MEERSVIIDMQPTDTRWQRGFDEDTWVHDGWTLRWRRRVGGGWELRGPFDTTVVPMHFHTRQRTLDRQALDDAIFVANGEAGE